MILLPSLVPTLRHLSPLPRADAAWWQRVVRWVWLAVAVAAVVALQAAASMPKGAPSIVRLELAGTAADPAILDQLRTSVRGDWWFIPAYVVLLAILVVWSGACYRLAGIRRLRRPAAYAVVAAGAFDVLENQMLLWGSERRRRPCHGTWPRRRPGRSSPSW